LRCGNSGSNEEVGIAQAAEEAEVVVHLPASLSGGNGDIFVTEIIDGEMPRHGDGCMICLILEGIL
jgi:hypothetical protein